MADRYGINVEAVWALTEAERAYIAGFFDGEGSITVTWREAHKNVLVHCAASQSRPAVPRWLHDVFGGTFHIEQPRNANTKPHYKWAVRGHNEARIFLQIILPHLRIKKQEAEEALEVLRTRKTMTGEQMKVHKDNIARFRNPA